MRIGLIEAGEPPPSLVPRFGTYGAMIARLLGGTGDAFRFAAFRAFEGSLPPPGACDALVVSGSACGANDALPWIADLADALRAAAKARTKLVGICFGHQLMARAFGGTVARAPQGWGVGLHRYEMVAESMGAAPWLDRDEAVALPASHQDQVVIAPPRSTVHARSAFTPVAVLSYADHPAMSCQFHPEFTPDFARALLDARRAPAITPAQRAAAIASLDGPNDSGRIAAWMKSFLLA